MMPAVNPILPRGVPPDFKLLNADYLLRSFACFAVKRGEMHVVRRQRSTGRRGGDGGPA